MNDMKDELERRFAARAEARMRLGDTLDDAYVFDGTEEE